MSPVGNALRNRMRMFPSIVNCCTIDWLKPWPQMALFQVAEIFLQELDPAEMDPAKKQSLSQMCVEVHESVQTVAE